MLRSLRYFTILEWKEYTYKQNGSAIGKHFVYSFYSRINCELSIAYFYDVCNVLDSVKNKDEVLTSRCQRQFDKLSYLYKKCNV